MIEELSIKKTDATTKAGIYTFFNSDNEIIYIGKAVNLRGRFCSYISKYGRYHSTFFYILVELFPFVFHIASSGVEPPSATHEAAVLPLD